MTFDEILEQVIALLKRQGRVAYRALKMRFDLGSSYYQNTALYPLTDLLQRALCFDEELVMRTVGNQSNAVQVRGCSYLIMLLHKAEEM